MKSRFFFTFLFLLCLLTVDVAAQYATAVSTGTAPVTITIPAGQVLQVLNFSGDGDTGRLAMTKGGITQTVFQSFFTGTVPPQSYFTGPATMAMTGDTGAAKLCLSYRLFDNSTVSGLTVPSTAVVIPADASGPVQIILEASTDLVNWTAASPGAYGNSTIKRFFRVRAVAQ